MRHFSLFQVRQFSITPRSFFRLKNFWKFRIMFNSCYSAVQDWRFCGIMHGPRDSMLAVKKLASECFINKYLMKMLVCIRKYEYILHQIIFESVVIYTNLSCGLVIHTTSSCEKRSAHRPRWPAYVWTGLFLLWLDSGLPQPDHVCEWDYARFKLRGLRWLSVITMYIVVHNEVKLFLKQDTDVVILANYVCSTEIYFKFFWMHNYITSYFKKIHIMKSHVRTWKYECFFRYDFIPIVL